VSLAQHARSVVRFGGASGLGLLLDYAIYTALHELGVPAGVANLFSASAGVTFVYVVSLRHVFAHLGAVSSRGTFLRYLAWQACAVPAASLAVGLLESALDGKFLLAKTLVLPFSFAANYLFMHWLLSRSAARAQAAPPA
jgi:putative flippase GtrA